MKEANWKEWIIPNEDEKPLDTLCADGGMSGIFRTVACVGDSLSSGEFEATNENGEKTYHDMFEYSWGQFFARMSGNTVYNFSRGGMTAKEYCESFADAMDYWNPEKKCRAYIIALGVNDLFNQGRLLEADEVGSVKDICVEDWRKNAHNFMGYYAQIIQRYKEIQPDAKFFLMAMPRSEAWDTARDELCKVHRKLLYDLAAFFSNTYVLDLYEYAPEYNEDFKRVYYLGGHLNPMGYVLTAKMLASYLDYIIRHNYNDFKQIGFVGTPFRYNE